MEMPWHNLLSDMGMDDDGDFFNQRHKNSMADEELVIGEFLLQSAFSSESESQSPQTQNNSCSTLSFDDAGTFLNNKHGKLLTKSNSSNSIASELVPEKHGTATVTSPSSYILSFDDSTVVAPTHEGYGRKQHNQEHAAGSGAARSSKGKRVNHTAKKARSSSESVDHIMAERKRRQELTERFIALSATIPGLKKIDKASILSEAITYVKQLQNRLKELEEQSTKKIKVESVSFINKVHLHSEEGTASCETTNSDDSHRLNAELPEVEARVLEMEVLIRIHCKKQNGILLKLLTHLRSLDLSIKSNSVLPFGNSALDISIIAEMGDKCNVKVKDLVNSLRVALLELYDVQQ